MVTRQPVMGDVKKGLRAALISLGSKSSLMTLEAMKKYFFEVDNINIKKLEVNISGKDSELLYDGKPLNNYDCIYAKGSFRFSPLLSSISFLLQDKTYMPIDATAFTVAHDKLLTHLALQKFNIPMPRTYIAATVDAAKEILRRMKFPIIMKFPQGTQGKGVVFADSYSSASSILDALTALRQPFIIQEYIETDGEDIRAFVIGDSVVASMKRRSKPDENRSNLHAGGSAESFVLDPMSQKIAVKAAKAIKAEICGVDLLLSPRGTMVIEANVSPGLQGITETTGVDIADKIASFLYARTEQLLDKSNSGKSDLIRSVVEDSNILMTSLDIRANRVFLPEIITKKCGFNEDDLYEIRSGDGLLEIKRMNIK